MRERLSSEQVILQAPMSYVGITRRVKRLMRPGHELADRAGDVDGAAKVATYAGAVAIFTGVWLLMFCAWLLVTGWYVLFGLLVVPYRLIRRGQRKDRLRELQHRELLAATQERRSAQP